MTEAQAQTLLAEVAQEQHIEATLIHEKIGRMHYGVKLVYKPARLVLTVIRMEDWPSIKQAWEMLTEPPVRCAWCNRISDPSIITQIITEPVCNNCLE